MSGYLMPGYPILVKGLIRRALLEIENNLHLMSAESQKYCESENDLQKRAYLSLFC